MKTLKNTLVLIFFTLSLNVIGQDIDHPFPIPDSCLFMADTVYLGCGDSFRSNVIHPYFNCPIDDYHLKIYNRWGELVFETRETEVFWDFKFDGYYYLVDGIYIYIITGLMSDSGTPFAVEKRGEVHVFK